MVGNGHYPAESVLLSRWKPDWTTPRHPTCRRLKCHQQTFKNQNIELHSLTHQNMHTSLLKFPHRNTIKIPQPSTQSANAVIFQENIFTPGGFCLYGILCSLEILRSLAHADQILSHRCKRMSFYQPVTFVWLNIVPDKNTCSHWKILWQQQRLQSCAQENVFFASEWLLSDWICGVWVRRRMSFHWVSGLCLIQCCLRCDKNLSSHCLSVQLKVLRQCGYQRVKRQI